MHNNKLLRYLDCAVIEYMHTRLQELVNAARELNGPSSLELFDSLRGAFIEGDPAFEGSGFYSKSHIQICIRNPNCIKGFFNPRKEIHREELLRALRAD